MKVQFKYAFLSGVAARGNVFIAVFALNAVFIVLGLLGVLPLPALITAVSLSGAAIAVMLVMNVIGDIAMIRRMFAAPGAYLYALTPVPRWKTLLANLITMAAMDIVSMTVAITGVTFISLILADAGTGNISNIVWNTSWLAAGDILFGIWMIVLMISAYLLILMVIISGVAVKKSLFYQKRGGGVLTVLMALGIICIINASPLLLAPFGEVYRWGLHFTVVLGRLGLAMSVPLLLIQTAVLFVITSKLMERKINL